MTGKSGRDFMKWAVLVAVLATIALPSLLSAETVSIPTATAMARIAKKVAPGYPAAAKQLNISGSLDVEITVNEEGSVTDAKVLKGNAMFSSSSLAAVKQWKFMPLVQDGVGKGFTSVIVFNFTK